MSFHNLLSAFSSADFAPLWKIVKTMPPSAWILIAVFVAVFFLEKKFKRYGKKSYTRKGDYVKSRAEMSVANWLYARSIRYRYEVPVCGYVPDFYLPDYDIYIEYWGLPNKSDYYKHMEEKSKTYRANGVKVINVFYKDLSNLNNVIGRKLGI